MTYVSGDLCPLVKHVYAPYGSEFARMRAKVQAFGSLRDCYQRHIQPPSLHCRRIDLYWVMGAGAKLGSWQH